MVDVKSYPTELPEFFSHFTYQTKTGGSGRNALLRFPTCWLISEDGTRARLGVTDRWSVAGGGSKATSGRDGIVAGGERKKRFGIKVHVVWRDRTSGEETITLPNENDSRAAIVQAKEDAGARASKGEVRWLRPAATGGLLV